MLLINMDDRLIVPPFSHYMTEETISCIKNLESNFKGYVILTISMVKPEIKSIYDSNKKNCPESKYFLDSHNL